MWNLNLALTANLAFGPIAPRTKHKTPRTPSSTTRYSAVGAFLPKKLSDPRDSWIGQMISRFSSVYHSPFESSLFPSISRPYCLCRFGKCMCEEARMFGARVWPAGLLLSRRMGDRWTYHGPVSGSSQPSVLVVFC
jgi:hypothetical protein